MRQKNNQPSPLPPEQMPDGLFWDGSEAAPAIPHHKGTRYSKHAKKRRKRAVILSAVSVFLAGLLVFGGWFLLFYEPEADTTAPKRQNVVQQMIGGGKKEEDEYAPVIDDLTRKKGVFNFLIGGIDRVAGLNDVMMLAQFDTGAKKVYVVQIPRDTYYSSNGYAAKLNSYFAICRNAARRAGSEDEYRAGIEGVKEFFESSLYIKIDYYLCVDTGGFRDVIDAIGGVDFNVPMDMDYEDPEQDLYIHLKAGMQHLDGDHAEQFVRFRKGYPTGDIGRLDAQKLFLGAVAQQVQNNLSVKTAVDISATVLDYMTTNISVADAAYFAKEAFNVKREDINFITMPGDATSSVGFSVYVMHRASMLHVINQCLNVYQTEITDELFDYYRVFNDTSDGTVNGYYNSWFNENECQLSSAAALAEANKES